MIKIICLMCLLLNFSLVSPQCSLAEEYKPIIQKYLAPFKEGITQDMIKRGAQMQYACLITIKDHSASWDCNNQKVSINAWYLNAIANQVPDMQFVLNMADNPVVEKNICQRGQLLRNCICDSNFQRPLDHNYFKWDIPAKAEPRWRNIPVFSPCVISECYLDIPFPAPAHTFYPDIQQIYSWEEKVFKAMWRGTPTGASQVWPSLQLCLKFQRCKMVALCKNIKDCDAKFLIFKSYNCIPKACIQMRQFLGESEIMSYSDQGKSKILLDIDGNTYSGRFPILLRSGSVVFKISAFPDLATLVMRPWEHYVPIKYDLSNLEERIKWAKQHDDEIRLIAERGAKKAFQILSAESLICYGIHLFQAYHKLLIKS